MKMHITLAIALLLTLGTAVAGTLVYGQGRFVVVVPETAAPPIAREPTAEMIALWKVTASSTEFVAPRAPI